MFKECIEVRYPAADLFKLSQDYGKRLHWDSFLAEARLLNAGAVSVGVKCFCRAWNGIGIESEYVSFKEPSVVAVKMTKGPWFFKDFAATWRFHEEGEFTRVTFLYHYKTRFIPEILIAPILKMEMRRRLRDLKRYCEALSRQTKSS